MTRKFIVDFHGEEDDPSADELTRADLIGKPREIAHGIARIKFYVGHKVAFTVDDMRKHARHMLARDPHHMRVRRGRNDELSCTMENVVEYTLFGNLIATYNPRDETLVLYDAGWRTKTTIDRLNTLLINEDIPFHIVQREFEWWILQVGNWNYHHAEHWEGQKEFKLA